MKRRGTMNFILFMILFTTVSTWLDRRIDRIKVK